MAILALWRDHQSHATKIWVTIALVAFAVLAFGLGNLWTRRHPNHVVVQQLEQDKLRKQAQRRSDMQEFDQGFGA